MTMKDGPQGVSVDLRSILRGSDGNVATGAGVSCMVQCVSFLDSVENNNNLHIELREKYPRKVLIAVLSSTISC